MTNVPFLRLSTDARMPRRAHGEDAGFDLYAAEAAELTPGSRAAVGCGFATALPSKMAALVLPRSGLALNEGLSVLNAPGLIDSGYRGEIKVILINHDATETRTINVGDRIAQLVLITLPDVDFREVEALPDSVRGDGGFGSTGRST